MLGYYLQEDGKHNITLNKLIAQIEQILGMIRRITRQKRGMKEHELRKVIEALIYSRVMYHLPYISLTKTQQKKLETTLRKASKLALGVPRFTATYKIKDAGLFNSLDDRVDMHKLGQKQRLETSLQGRRILTKLNYETTNLPPIPLETPPWEQIPRIHVDPIPKNMHTKLNADRRNDRVQRLEKKDEEDTSTKTYYTDASYNAGHGLIAVWNIEETLTRRYQDIPSPRLAELLAISTAITEFTKNNDKIIIRTDSQDACRAFLNNKLPTSIQNRLQHHMHKYPHKLEFNGSQDTRHQEETCKHISLPANQIRIALSPGPVIRNTTPNKKEKYFTKPGNKF